MSTAVPRDPRTDEEYVKAEVIVLVRRVASGDLPADTVENLLWFCLETLRCLPSAPEHAPGRARVAETVRAAIIDLESRRHKEPTDVN